MKKQFTKEEKSAYFAALREQWNKAKGMSEEQKNQAAAIMLAHGLNCSQVGFCYVFAQMQAQGLDGIPYVDARTFDGWKESGFRVRKGEHSSLSGLTWIKAKSTSEGIPDEETKTFIFPKLYRLFHRSQVEPI